MAPRTKRDGSDSKFAFQIFDPGCMRYDCTCAAFGSRGGGKTNLARNLQVIMDLPRSIVICPSPEVHRKYRDWPRCWRFQEFKESKIEAIMMEQDKIAQEINKDHTNFMEEMEAEANADHEREIAALKQALQKEGTEKNWDEDKASRVWLKRNAILKKRWDEESEERQRQYKIREDGKRSPYALNMIWDDIASDPEILKSKVLKKLMNNGRHYITCLIVLIQYCIDWPAALRSALDYIFIFKETSPKNLKRLYEYYASSFFQEYDDFVRILNSMTEKFGCMVLDMRARSNQLEDHVFFWEPKFLDYQRFRVGHPIFQILADQLSKKDKQNDEEDPDEPKETESAPVPKPISRFVELEQRVEEKRELTRKEQQKRPRIIGPSKQFIPGKTNSGSGFGSVSTNDDDSDDEGPASASVPSTNHTPNTSQFVSIPRPSITMQASHGQTSNAQPTNSQSALNNSSLASAFN